MISNLGWGTFLLWGLFDAVIAIVTFFFLRETQGLSLEEIAHNDFGEARNFKVDHENPDIDHTEHITASSK